MSLVQTRRIKNAVLTMLILTFSMVIQQRQSTRKEAASADYEAARLKDNQILINRYIDQLYSQYNGGNYDEAQSTFLALKQTWQYQDVIVKSLPVEDYYPSDSLQHLDSLLALPASTVNHFLVIKEIRRINIRLANY
ncbi:hypothetical protein [Dyadobacter sandarakinus]|uniref:Uncharacterized protein n=1 Tax=Dyadobacter sandarakinus TaxID=2747268 RepID=A0ABX7I3L4_9BACT|nr:hypothetical protein [Dyadobacter sandarakinus]QRR00157.1 hypothetical protein HWI92_04175 [Dyadobacter sandarakinus]